MRLRGADENAEPDAVAQRRPGHLAAHRRGRTAAAWTAFRAGRLRIRGSLHVGVGFLAATSGRDEPGRLAFETRPHARVRRISVLSAGAGPETVVCVHGLGGTKASFLPTVAALADHYRVVAHGPPRLRRVGQADRRAVRRPPGSRGRCSS